MFNLVEEIYDKAQRMGGEAGETLEFLCRLAEAELMSLLRDDVETDEKLKQDLIDCGAMLALENMERTKAKGVKSCRAGNISVSYSYDIPGSAMDMTLKILRPYIKDAFIFKAVD